jgi:hypothetical protein
MSTNSNVPLIHLPTFNSLYHKSSDYFTSKSYVNDALNVSLYIPFTHSPRISCSIDKNYHERQTSLKNIKQMIFNNQFKVNRRCTCPKQHIKPKRKKSIPMKKLPINPRKHFLVKKHQPTPSISSYRTPPTNIKKIPIKAPFNITSHTRFGKSMLALHFQKYGFTSPIKTSKKDQFLHLLKLNKSKNNHMYISDHQSL